MKPTKRDLEIAREEAGCKFCRLDWYDCESVCGRCGRIYAALRALRLARKSRKDSR